MKNDEFCFGEVEFMSLRDIRSTYYQLVLVLGVGGFRVEGWVSVDYVWFGLRCG